MCFAVPGRLLILLCLLGLAALAPVAAQDVPSGEQTPIGEVEASSPGNDRVALVSTWDFVRMILILAAVVATIYVVFLVVRKTGRRGVGSGYQGSIRRYSGLSGIWRRYRPPRSRPRKWMKALSAFEVRGRNSLP